MEAQYLNALGFLLAAQRPLQASLAGENVLGYCSLSGLANIRSLGVISAVIRITNAFIKAIISNGSTVATEKT